MSKHLAAFLGCLLITSIVLLLSAGSSLRDSGRSAGADHKGVHQRPSQRQLSAEVPRQAHNRTLYMFRTHAGNQFGQARYEQMREQLGAESVYLLLDDTHQSAQGTRIAGHVAGVGDSHRLLINESECSSASSLHTNMYHMPHIQMALANKYLQPVVFSYIWFVEWDAVCHGDYGECFSLPDALQGKDFLAVDVEPYSERLKGWRWGELVGELSDLPTESRWKSFFPVVRFSKTFLANISTDMASSSGFSEVYVPTLCSTLQSCSLGALPRRELGPFGASGNLTLPALADDKWYHPVKY